MTASVEGVNTTGQPVTIEELGPVVDSVAGQILRRYRWFSSREDIRQHLWVWMLTPGKGRKAGKPKVEKWLAAAVDDPNEFIRIRLALRAVATEFCEQEKADQSGYSVEDVAWYTPAKIAQLVPDALDPTYDGGAVQGTSEDGTGGKGTSLPEQQSDRLAAVMDVRRVIDRWSSAERGALYDLGDTFDYAVARVLDELGGEHPRRLVMSNAQAQALTNRDSGAV